MGNWQRNKPGASLQEAMYAHIGLRVDGGMLGEVPENPPFRPIVCSVDGCENRHAPEDDWTIYVLRNQAYDYRWGRLICSEHLQEEIELMLPGLFGPSTLEVREANPEDWVLSGDRVERGFYGFHPGRSLPTPQPEGVASTQPISESGEGA